MALDSPLLLKAEFGSQNVHSSQGRAGDAAALTALQEMYRRLSLSPERAATATGFPAKAEFLGRRSGWHGTMLAGLQHAG
jgi:hypothetical protein